MPSKKIQRPASKAELEHLQKLLKGSATTAGRWRQGIENALVLWAVSLMGVVLIWLACAWLARKTLGLEIGMRSPAALWILGISLPLCGLYAAVSSFRWISSSKDRRPQLASDIEKAEVVEEHYHFVEAKRFQEQEHGGLMYFLRTANDKVLTLFDYESQELGVDGKDPLQSQFQPKSELVMVRTPATGLVIGQKFSGEVLNVGEPIVLELAPDRWPESEAYCSIPWLKLESKLGPSAR